MVSTSKVTNVEAPKSDIKSGTIREETIKILGGMPKVKTVAEISDACSPTARKKAPGSVRV